MISIIITWLYAAPLVCAILLAIALTRKVATNLNLECNMPDPVVVTTDKKPQFSIHPTAAGKVLVVADSLSNIEWKVSDEAVADIAQTKPDASAVELRAKAVGVVTLSVSALNKAGKQLIEYTSVEFVDPPADALGLQYDGVA